MCHWRPELEISNFEHCTGSSDLDRKGRNPVHLARGKDRRASESPGPVHDHPYAKTLALVVRQTLDHPVLDGDPLRAPDDDADVCVACALNLCQVQGSICKCSQRASSFVFDDCRAPDRAPGLMSCST